MKVNQARASIRERRLAGAIVAGTVVLAVGSLGWWFRVEPGVSVDRRIPFQDGTTADDGAAAAVLARIQLDDWYQRFDAEATPTPGAWPQFRGPARDNIDPAPPALVETWGEAGPPVLWEMDVGEGYAGPAVWDGRLYLLDYDEEAGGDLLRCFRLEDGRELWRRGYEIRIKRNHGMSRTVPAVAEGAVVSMGPKCQVLCADAETGEFRWGLDLAADYGTKVPLWYTGQCPLIDQGLAILAPCGNEDLMIAVDLVTGEVRWHAPNHARWDMSHGSVMPMTLAGRRTFVYAAIGGLVGVAADGPDAGSILWETKEWNLAVVAPSPVDMGQDRVLVTAGYGAGSMVFHIRPEGDGFAADPVHTFDKKTFGCEQQTPIWFQGHFYGVMPADGGGINRQLVCVDPAGALQWSSGKERRFGLGPFLVAGDRLFALGEDGDLVMVHADPGDYREMASAKVLDGREAWAPMALAGTRLLVRDNRRMRCLDLSGGQGAS